MATNATPTQERTAVRPTYFDLGTDTEGAHHTYCTLTDEVHVVQDGAREIVQELDGRDIDDWMDYVQQERGWSRKLYGVSLGEVLVDGLRGEA